MSEMKWDSAPTPWSGDAAGAAATTDTATFQPTLADRVAWLLESDHGLACRAGLRSDPPPRPSVTYPHDEGQWLDCEERFLSEMPEDVVKEIRQRLVEAGHLQ